MTSGFDVAKVLTALHSRIGWRQPAAAGSPALTSSNTTTKSGRYFQDFHSLVSVQNVKSTMEEAGPSDANLNAHLTSITNAAIMRCLSSVFQVKDFIEHTVVLEPLARQSVRSITNSGLFVGFEIGIAKRTDITLQIDSVQLLFDDSTTFNLYLFAEGKKDPIATIDTISTVAGEQVIIPVSEELLISYIGSDYQDARFYLGYFQDDVAPAKAIVRDVCFADTKVFYARPMQAKRKDNGNDFDRSEISYTSQLQGLNLEISAFRDHTQQIIKNASLFDEAIGLTAAYMVIEQVMNSTQSNATERILKEGLDRIGLQLELTGAAPISDSPKVKGIAQRIEAEYDRLRKSFYPKPKAQVINLAAC